MILHPGILALLSLSLLVLIVMVAASCVGIRIFVAWDRNSNSELQLSLERRTWLVSSLLDYALYAQIFSLVLFVYTADEIHSMFIGAMCATGSLNANLVGWLVLLVKILLLFMAVLWVVFNRLDQKTEAMSLTRMKYAFLLILTPLIALDLYLQWLYFSGLQPEVITSCCGSLFTSEGEGVAAELSGMAPVLAMRLFFTVVGCYLLVLLGLIWKRVNFLRILLFPLSVLLFFTSLGAIVSFISLYIYQMPTHHCPFDMLQHHYGYIGYPLYAGLFGATLFGLLPGLAYSLRNDSLLWCEFLQVEQRWLLLALTCFLLFMVTACWQMVFGSFRLLGY